MSVNLSQGDYDDSVLADGHKHRCVLRSGQFLVMRKGDRWPVVYGDHGSNRESALAHFRQLEEPFYRDGE